MARWRGWLAMVLVVLAVLSVLGRATEEGTGLGSSERPNVLVLLVDDLGYGDLACFGRENVSTPNVDSLARDGTKFVQWISAASVCKEHTIGEMLRTVDYATGMSGKWQGTAEEVQYCMIMANNTIVEQPTNYDNLTQSYVHVHSPLFSSPAFFNVSRGGRFGDNVEEMDHSVGRILNTLDELGIANDTLVILTSDNGPFAEEGWDKAGRTGGLKGSKGQTYEGGIRMPGLARWPGRIPAGRVSNAPISTLDIMPTLAELTGASLPADRLIDGMSILNELYGQEDPAVRNRTMWHYCGHNVTAARFGRYKLHFATPVWTSDARPSPLCTECCPYGPTNFNGTGGSLCDCAEENLLFHDPPLVFDMILDMEENYPLSAANITNFDQLVASAKSALAAHYATVQPFPNQMLSLPVPALVPCCEGSWVNHDACMCQRYQEGHVYP
ncbi:uncharacterized protein MONBRDRAFT_32135 [Monosiga brevicollis MX1]|uniref:Sulfatase N-terminal domain-containing protein n=1 Tax=Monosiga brevicollis TaxID=81824 RepID=A9UXW0_MONBE|nr:uncharacterized protein MONBRDRAFT_32135 [Monosiga brevicollis MX1]EDQ89914.1 predicted protein [Monosiga brevicollis MX1]|eukprot:XP_001745336.1 hypothetical protein [Monosiga brevicollis MX1]